MTNLTCFDYMHFKGLILQTFTFIYTTEFISITPAAQAFLEQSPLPAVPSLEMGLLPNHIINRQKIKMNHLIPFAMEA